MEAKKKIFITVLPSFGHINPITGLAKELVAKNKYEIIFYGNPEHRDVIERTGTTFRPYVNMPICETKSKPLNEDKHDTLEAFFTKMINFSYKSVPVLLDEIEKEKPDLIIYDHMSLPARYVLKIMDTRFKKGLSNIPAPLGVNFYTCFPNKKGVFPSDEQMKELCGTGLRAIASMAKVVYKQTMFSWKYGIDIYNPFEFVFNESDKLNIVSVFPELQPYSDQFDTSYKFVGSCISESVRKTQTFETKLKEVLDQFDAINPNFEKKENKFKLIYASLGTVFNNNVFVFDMIIDAIRLLNETNVEDTYDLKVIISVGKDNVKLYENKVMNEKLQVPENVLLMATVPQIDVLERTSLFITHCGMNSACEAIQYGVPVICLPIKADQPLVAHRLADELNLGIRFDPLEMKSNDLKTAIDIILRDYSYTERMLKFTQISRNYNGSVTSANLVEEYLEKENQSTN